MPPIPHTIASRRWIDWNAADPSASASQHRSAPADLS
jgi:hypothetical protein